MQVSHDECTWTVALSTILVEFAMWLVYSCVESTFSVNSQFKCPGSLQPDMQVCT